jgi:HAD superfamily hydrolase (TIGR01509 family)
MESFGVIFDSDGVIVDSEPFSLAAFRQAMEEQGVFLNDKDIMANCGLTDADIVRYVSEKFGIEADLDLFHSRKQNLYQEMILSGNLKACEGAVELLSNLERLNIPFALASSGSIRKIRLNLTHVGLWDRFPVKISGEDMKRGKPHPDIFLASAERLNLAPDRCVVIEDSLNGIEAAHRAGMKCVAVIGTFKREHLSKADFIIDSLSYLTVEKLKSLVLDKNFSKGGNSC